MIKFDKGNQSLHTHTIILCGQSTYFKNLCERGFKVRCLSYRHDVELTPIRRASRLRSSFTTTTRMPSALSSSICMASTTRPISVQRKTS